MKLVADPNLLRQLDIDGQQLLARRIPASRSKNVQANPVAHVAQLREATR